MSILDFSLLTETTLQTFIQWPVENIWPLRYLSHVFQMINGILVGFITYIIFVLTKELERVCSQTQLRQLRCFNETIRQLYVSGPTDYLQVVFEKT